MVTARDVSELCMSPTLTQTWTRRVKLDGSTVFTCKPCPDHRERLFLHNWKGHEETYTHRAGLKQFDAEPHNLSTVHASQAVNGLPLVEDGFRTLLLAAIGNVAQPLYPISHTALPPVADVTQNSLSHVTGIGWLRNLLEAIGETELELTPLQRIFAQVVQASLDFLNADLSDDEQVERESEGKRRTS